MNEMLPPVGCSIVYQISRIGINRTLDIWSYVFLERVLCKIVEFWAATKSQSALNAILKNLYESALLQMFV